MKAPYKLANGKTAELEVNSAVAEALADFKRQDDNEERKKRWRNEISLDALYEETEWEPTDTTVNIEADFLVQEETKTLLAAMARLSEKQRRLIRLYYYEEKNFTEIAAIFRINRRSVSKQIETIHKKMKKYFL